MAKESDTSPKDRQEKDRYEKDLGHLPDVELRPFRTTDVAALTESMRRLRQTTGRLTRAFILLTAALVVVGVVDHWTTVQAALVALDHWRQQWWR